MQKSNTFPKSERLCGEIRIAKLFVEGKAFIAYPFRIVYQTTTQPTDAPVKVLISAPKKKFKKATDRNRLKRQMREAYRLNKHELVDICRENNIYLQIAINYIADKKLGFELINEKMIVVLNKIISQINP